MEAALPNEGPPEGPRALGAPMPPRLVFPGFILLLFGGAPYFPFDWTKFIFPLLEAPPARDWPLPPFPNAKTNIKNGGKNLSNFVGIFSVGKEVG